MGDACQDTDADGVLDVDDNCPEVANADQADADDNDVGDACQQDELSSSGCGCGVASGGVPATLPAMSLLLLVWFGWRLRRRRQQVGTYPWDRRRAHGRR